MARFWRKFVDQIPGAAVWGSFKQTSGVSYRRSDVSGSIPLIFRRRSFAAGKAGREANSTNNFKGRSNIICAETLSKESSSNCSSNHSCSLNKWWAPDPCTGVWWPEGQELHTHVSKGAVDQLWFREDVHLMRTDHHERSA